MKKIIAIVGVVALLSICLTGCAGGGNVRKLKKMAKSYIKDKYGINAKVTDVNLDTLGWLDPIWAKSKSGVLLMKYNDKEFTVWASIDSKTCTDNYLNDDIEAMIKEYLDEKLQCDDICYRISYGVGNSKNQVGRDVKTVDDIMATEEKFTVQISSYGLNKDNISAIDIHKFGPYLNVIVSDWKDKKVVEEGYISSAFTEPVITEELDLNYFVAIDENEDENAEFEYESVNFGDLIIVYDKNDGDSISVNESTNPPSSSKTGVTSWIEIRNIGNKNANYTILYPFNNDANKFCVEEMTNDTGLLTPHMPNNTETKGDTWSGRKSYHFYWGSVDSGESITLRVAEEN